MDTVIQRPPGWMGFDRAPDRRRRCSATGKLPGLLPLPPALAHDRHPHPHRHHHLRHPAPGNYVGAIRPAVAASRTPGSQNFYFLADLHALIKVQDPAKVQRSTLEIAASWLACGLQPDNDRVWFYRQSDIHEIPELTWFLTCVASKGLLNRAHAYKAAVDRNRAEGLEDQEDHGITAGLFMYPVLMAADIMIFNAHKVPVGRDQIQHIEMARDFAQRFNHLYGDHFVLPEAMIEEHVATLPGLDGRKMSKSYDNTIPLFAPRDQLKKLIFSIVTDSRMPGEAKDTEARHCSSSTRPSPAPRRPRPCARPSPTASAGAMPSSACSNASTPRSRRCAIVTRR